MCRYNFGKFFTDRTSGAILLPSDMSKITKNEIFTKRDHILTNVETYIDEHFTPKKRNIFSGVIFLELSSQLTALNKLWKLSVL